MDHLEFRSSGTSGGALRCLPLRDLVIVGDCRLVVVGDCSLVIVGDCSKVGWGTVDELGDERSGRRGDCSASDEEGECWSSGTCDQDVRLILS